MNSPLVVEQVRHITQRSEFRNLNSDDERVRYLYSSFSSDHRRRMN